jgi:hypothetical protein
VPVPKASVYEHRHPVAGKNDVGLARQFQVVESVPEACAMKGLPYKELGRGVRGFHLCHNPASGRRIDIVSHLGSRFGLPLGRCHRTLPDVS